MAEPLQEDYENAGRDLSDLGAIVNDAADRPNPGQAAGTVTTRLGRVVRTVANVIASITATENVAKGYRDEARTARDQASDFADNAAESAASIPSLAPAIPGKDFATEDDYGNAGLAFSPTGDVEVNRLYASDLNGLGVDELKRRTFLRARLMSTIAHVISYGQSLSLGNAASPYQLAAETAGFLRFNANGFNGAGPRAQQGSGTVAQNHASLVPLREELNPNTGDGQTVLGPAFRMIKSLLLSENGIDIDAYPYKLLGSAPGQSNTKLDGLNKNTAPYNNLVADITYGASLAGDGANNTLGYPASYAVPAMLFSQGEADAGQSGQPVTSRVNYLAQLLQFYTDVNNQVKATTGQADDIKLILYQMTYFSQTNPNIALAQLDAADANPNIVVACPIYQLEHLNPNNVHLNGFGYDTLGAYYGVTFKREVIDSTRFKCVRPKTATRCGRIVTVDFDVPVPPLVIDNALFATLANAGLTAVKADGSNNPILSVHRVGPTTLAVELTSPEVGKLRSGFASWGSNIRDSQTLDAGGARRFKLYNGCVAFEKDFN